MLVSTDCLFGGGVFIIERSLAPSNENCRVLGIGVALKVSVSIFSLISFILSLIFTPNFCSSSTINKPKSLNITSLLTNLCVPIMISVCLFKIFLIEFFCSFFVLNRLI